MKFGGDSQDIKEHSQGREEGLQREVLKPLEPFVTFQNHIFGKKNKGSLNILWGFWVSKGVERPIRNCKGRANQGLNDFDKDNLTQIRLAEFSQSRESESLSGVLPGTARFREKVCRLPRGRFSDSGPHSNTKCWAWLPASKKYDSVRSDFMVHPFGVDPLSCATAGCSLAL